MLKVVMIGATGAVGTEVVRELVSLDRVERVTLLGRREFDGVSHPKIDQHLVDVLDSASYREHLEGAQVAVCTLGVGQPSKVSREQFVKVDHDAALDFGRAAREAGAGHFQLLSSVGADSSSRSFYLGSKGRLEDGLRALQFDRLSLFHPSMILTPANRYGFSQAVTLAVWPWLRPLLAGPLRKFRGVRVDVLGRSIARNVGVPATGMPATGMPATGMPATGVEILEWDEIFALGGEPSSVR